MYSMIRVPLAMRRVAKTPRPCTLERRTSINSEAFTSGSTLGTAATSDRHRRLDRRMMLVIHEFKVLILVGENIGGPPAQPQLRQRQGRAPELQIGLLQMVQIQVAVATGPDQLP